MRKLLRWLGYAVSVIFMLLLVFALWTWFASARVLGRTHEASTERLPAPSAAQLADAERQARILGCLSCHGEGLRGRMMFDAGPFAKVWTPNLTELAERASDQQLAQGIRQGIGYDGRALFVMPSPMYQHLSDEETAALVAWIRSLPRSGERVSDIQWGPVGRIMLALGRFPSAVERMEEFRLRQPYDTGPEQAAGRRIATLVCTECHGADLGGGRPTPDTVAPGLSVVGAYDPEQFRTLLRTGVPPGGRDLGLMSEFARNDTRHMTDEEVARLYAYLHARAQRVQDPPPEAP